MRSLGFIGCGNMGGIICRAIHKSYPELPIYIYDHHVSLDTEWVSDESYVVCSSEEEVASKAEYVILAIKPQHLPKVLKKIASCVTTNQCIVSIAAGVEMDTIQSYFNNALPIIRLMPNTPAEVGEGMTAMMVNDLVKEEQLQYIKSLCECFGRCVQINESQIHGFIAVCGSSIAYYCMMLESLGDAGVKAGLKRKDAYEFAAQAMLGTAAMYLNDPKHPGILKDMVASPAGTTIEAVNTLEKMGFRGAVIEAAEACAKRSMEMSNKK